MVPDLADEDGGDDGSYEVGDKVPAGVLIIADVVLRDDHGGEELYYFVEGAEAHAAGGADAKHAQGRLEGAAVAAAGAAGKGLPAKPGDEADAASVDELVVFEVAGNEAPVVEDAGGIGGVPCIGDGDEAADHVGKAPEAESPEQATTEPGTAVDAEDGDDDEAHHGEVEEKFVVPLYEDPDGSDGEEAVAEYEHVSELLFCGDVAHV